MAQAETTWQFELRTKAPTGRTHSKEVSGVNRFAIADSRFAIS